ncbi:tRNA pseudouridine(38-40) synthase TruA [Solilutibacter silvestris]|uniref:tRNA pseudouridine synthase A n=1 Tax=Solilutibacter silvestris TaxID=1645665 RepID=A0A2K1PZ06_9GAMM|nr:tRNA pseudouridine(38-40) synthase TruA [Lysobacter silvestris]PNS08010.1 tRNA pseudouridine(38-40) synthase [Lysobacter silvestris]
MPRYALGVEYDGSAFHGWQRVEAGVRNVQETLETALSSVADHQVRVVCAGRTDAGVHARCQVVHFDSDAVRDARAWTLGTTSRLPADVGVLWCREVPDTFSARFSALSRRYRYRILNRQVRPAFERQYLTWELRPLDHSRMHAAAQFLVGEHDFEAFRSAQCQATHARRHLHSISVERHGDEVVMDIQANAFLHHMVRNIVGSLLPVGRGERPVEWIAELLAGRDRTLAGPTAPAQGLLFVGPQYPGEWTLPTENTFTPREPE